jgi:hypothetical protein
MRLLRQSWSMPFQPHFDSCDKRRGLAQCITSVMVTHRPRDVVAERVSAAPDGIEELKSRCRRPTEGNQSTLERGGVGTTDPRSHSIAGRVNDHLARNECGLVGQAEAIVGRETLE